MALNIVIDSSSLIFRAFYAVAYRAEDIEPALSLYKNWLLRISCMFDFDLDKINNAEVKLYCAIDKNNRESDNFKLIDNYKDGREMPELLKDNFEKFHDLEKELKFNVVGVDGEEADDVAASIAEELYLNDKNYLGTFIVSADRDLFQLANKQKRISIIRPESENHKTSFNVYNAEKVCDYFGINNASQVVDYKALTGDGSDGYAGVRGIGNKRALNLINKYNSLDEIYNHIDEIKGKQKEYLLDGKDDAYTCYKLAKLNNKLFV